MLEIVRLCCKLQNVTHKVKYMYAVGLDSEKRLFSRKDAKRCEKRQNDAEKRKKREMKGGKRYIQDI